MGIATQISRDEVTGGVQPVFSVSGSAKTNGKQMIDVSATRKSFIVEIRLLLNVKSALSAEHFDYQARNQLR